MLMAQELVQGADLWINTPRRPWEACGTSGMKVLVNGGLNFSELDGWWAEAYSPQVGWAIGDGKDHGDDPAVDAAEAEAMYTLLEQEVIPEFYERSGNGIAIKWLAGCARVWRGSRRNFLPAAPFGNTPKTTISPRHRPIANAPPRTALWVLRSQVAAQNRARVEHGALRRNAGGNPRRPAFLPVQVSPGNLLHSDLKVELYAIRLGKGRRH